jgi:hypothetical protein
MLLAHLLDSPGKPALLWRKPFVEVDVVALFQMKPDEGGIGDDVLSIADIGQLAFWGSAESLGIRAIGQAGHFQKHFGLRHEGAWVWEAEGRAERVKRDHGASVPSPNCRPTCSALARQFGDKGTLAKTMN